MEHQALIVNDDIVPQLVTLDPSGWAAATALFGTSEIEWRLLAFSVGRSAISDSSPVAPTIWQPE